MGQPSLGPQHPLTKGPSPPQPLPPCRAAQSWGQSQPRGGLLALQCVPVTAGGTGSGLETLGIWTNVCCRGRAARSPVYPSSKLLCPPVPQFPSWHKEAGAGSLSLSNARTKSHSRAARVLQTCILPSSRCILGLNVAFSLCIGFPLPTAVLGQPRWGLSWLYVCWGPARTRLDRLGREPALEAVSSPSSCLRSRAPLRHCPTKSSAAVIHR